MLNCVQNLLCSIVPTALAARCQARIALSMGEYGIAADCYVTAARRLENRVLAPRFSQPLFPHVLKKCARAARRVAKEEGQKMRYRVLMANLSDDAFFHVTAGIPIAMYPEEGHPLLTTDERFLLVLHEPLGAQNLLVDLGAACLLGSPVSSVHRLFKIRYLATLAAQGDMVAMDNLGQRAIHSDAAHRALARLAEAGVPGASLQMSAVRSERHSIFLNRQRMERERDKAFDRMVDEMVRYRVF